MANNSPDCSDTVANAHTGLATGRVSSVARPAPALERLNIFIGRWITEGETVGSGGVAPVRIVASDVYQWVPGNHFVMHPAYGRLGSVDVGGLEVIGYDPETGQYRTYFFDSQGTTITEALTCQGNTWIWRGAHARCTGVFTDDGRTLTARHERSDDGKCWTPSMTVTLRKID
jgi:hypothetical protein